MSFNFRSPGLLSSVQIHPLGGNVQYAGLPTALSGAPVDLQFTPNLRLIPFHGVGSYSPADKQRYLISAPTVTLNNNARTDYTIITLKTFSNGNPFSDIYDYYGAVIPLSGRDRTKIRHYIDQTSNIPFFPISGVNSLDRLTSPEGDIYPKFDALHSTTFDNTVPHFQPNPLRTLAEDHIPPGYVNLDRTKLNGGFFFSPGVGFYEITSGDISLSAKTFGYIFDPYLNQIPGTPPNVLSGIGPVGTTHQLHDVLSFYNGNLTNTQSGAFTDGIDVDFGYTHTSAVARGLYASYRKKNVIARPLLISYDGENLTSDYAYSQPSMASIAAGTAHAKPTVAIATTTIRAGACLQQRGGCRRNPSTGQYEGIGNVSDNIDSSVLAAGCVPTGQDPCAGFNNPVGCGEPIGSANIVYRQYDGFSLTFGTTGFNPYVYDPVFYITTVHRAVETANPYLSAVDVVFKDGTFAFRTTGSPLNFPTSTVLQSVESTTNSLSSYNFSKISLGPNFVIGLTLSGRIVGYGDNTFFQTNIPYQLSAYNNNILDIAAGTNFSAILSSNGRVYGWGGGLLTTTSTLTPASSSQEGTLLSGTNVTFTGISSGGNDSLKLLLPVIPALSADTFIKIFSTFKDTLVGITSGGNVIEFINSVLTRASFVSAVQFIQPGNTTITDSPSSRYTQIVNVKELSYNSRTTTYTKNDGTVVQFDSVYAPYDTTAFVVSSCLHGIATSNFNHYATNNGAVTSFNGGQTAEYPISGAYVNVMTSTGLSAIDIKRYEYTIDSYAVLFSNSTVGIVSGGTTPFRLTFIPSATGVTSINTSYATQKSSTLAVIYSGGNVRFYGDKFIKEVIPPYTVGQYTYQTIPTVLFDARTGNLYGTPSNDTAKRDFEAYYVGHELHLYNIDPPPSRDIDNNFVTSYDCKDCVVTRYPAINQNFFSHAGHSMSNIGPAYHGGGYPRFFNTPDFLVDRRSYFLYWNFNSYIGAFLGSIRGFYNLETLEGYYRDLNNTSLTTATRSANGAECPPGVLDFRVPVVQKYKARIQEALFVMPALLPKPEILSVTTVPTITGNIRARIVNETINYCKVVFPDVLASGKVNCCSCNPPTIADLGSLGCKKTITLKRFPQLVESTIFNGTLPAMNVSDSADLPCDPPIAYGEVVDPRLGSPGDCTTIRESGACRVNSSVICPPPDPINVNVSSYSSFSG